MSGNGNSGRKPNSKSREDSMRSLTLKLPKAIQVIENTMDGINRERLPYEAAVMIKESVLGKSRQPIDATLDTDVLLTLELKRYLDDKLLPGPRVGITEGINATKQEER